MFAAVVAILVLAALVGVSIWIVQRTLLQPPAPVAAPAGELERVPPVDRRAPAIVRRSERASIVLVHGLFGFDSLGVGPARVEYFRGIARRLAERGVDVSIARVPPLAGVPARALALCTQLDAIASDRITLVGHSLGGLDARWALARSGIADRVESLVTIGTPHRGTPIADLVCGGAADRLRGIMGRLGLGTDALEWLTTAKLEGFNREVGDADGVRYASVVTATTDRAKVHALLRVPHALLARYGPSDGLVPAWSQSWGDVVAHAEVDHWAQIGWSRPAGHDATELIVRALDAVKALPPSRPVRLLTA